MRLAASFALLGVTLTACYRFEPSAPVQPVTGDDVRLTLSSDATTRLAPALGAGTKQLAGRILAADASEFALAVDRTFKEDGVAVVWGGDRVTIPRNAIVLTERRVLDKRRTLMTTGGAVLSAVVSGFIMSKARANAGQSGDGTPVPPPP